MTIQQDFLVQIKPKPSPFKAKLKDLGISAGAVAQYLNLTYPYVLNMLNGAHPMTPNVEIKIKELIQKLASQ